MKWARRFLIGTAVLLCAALTPLAFFNATAGDSVCFGTTANGRIEGAVQMRAVGPNFEPYCWPCVAALRTFGHEKVIETAVAAYGDLAKTRPGVKFVYGEIGVPGGGRFPPHRTHQNGLSVDFMVPVLQGKSRKTAKPGQLPRSPMNRFGYSETFDSAGVKKLADGTFRYIDFDVIADHLLALDQQARKRGGKIWRVILAPNLQDDLFRTRRGQLVRKRLKFNRNAAWSRHDDHYHVDFSFPCR